MADKKLNAVSTASDGAYVYAEDASGNQIKISKADLATVVAELLSYSHQNMLADRGTLTAEQEASVTLQTGIYFQNQNPLASVDGTPLYHGVLVCINAIRNDKFGFGVQFYFTGDGTKRYARVMEWSTLGVWTQI